MNGGVRERALENMREDARRGLRPRPLAREMRAVRERDRSGGPVCQDRAAWEDVT